MKSSEIIDLHKIFAPFQKIRFYLYFLIKKYHQKLPFLYVLVIGKDYEVETIVYRKSTNNDI